MNRILCLFLLLCSFYTHAQQNILFVGFADNYFIEETDATYRKFHQGQAPAFRKALLQGFVNEWGGSDILSASNEMFGLQSKNIYVNQRNASGQWYFGVAGFANADATKAIMEEEGADAMLLITYYKIYPKKDHYGRTYWSHRMDYQMVNKDLETLYAGHMEMNSLGGQEVSPEQMLEAYEEAAAYIKEDYSLQSANNKEKTTDKIKGLFRRKRG